MDKHPHEGSKKPTPGTSGEGCSKEPSNAHAKACTQCRLPTDICLCHLCEVLIEFFNEQSWESYSKCPILAKHVFKLVLANKFKFETIVPCQEFFENKNVLTEDAIEIISKKNTQKRDDEMTEMIIKIFADYIRSRAIQAHYRPEESPTECPRQYYSRLKESNHKDGLQMILDRPDYTNRFRGFFTGKNEGVRCNSPLIRICKDKTRKKIGNLVKKWQKDLRKGRFNSFEEALGFFEEELKKPGAKLPSLIMDIIGAQKHLQMKLN